MCQMSAQSNILIGIKTLIILIPLLLTIRFGVIHLYEDSEECPKDERLEFDRCSLKLSAFGVNYRMWQSANFPAQDLQLISKLKLQCQEVPKCFENVPSHCKETPSAIESFPMWCRRIYFFSGPFSKCAGKINQISGRNECAENFLDPKFFEKSHEAKCQILANNKECIHESVAKTCAKVMADVLAQHINTEKKIIGC
ncbi:hypothetical protein L5515_009088 [Caenorhabditis briggsae]|uniref:T20D4.11-like domain-containing protein n=1 Tax=Caenorhabditis briggsae TaxID=6238 RepID=A0AAE9F7Y3_CAEBR|nr:hypothetical protein L5515_009088 [Caenorhabditis briggsae]